MRYLPDRAKTEVETMKQSRGRGSKVETEARQCEAEARPSRLKTASRPPRAEADASRTTSLVTSDSDFNVMTFFEVVYLKNGAS